MRIVVLHKNLNGETSERFFLNWSNAEVALEKDVKATGGEVRERNVDIDGDKWKYGVYSFLGAAGGCGWWLTEHDLEDM